ncbi:MAG TPA: CAP domain-containing protein [Actinomycetota bacterium]|nr:CAP domain-containing protein [Actinomycetota bacterium]
MRTTRSRRVGTGALLVVLLSGVLLVAAAPGQAQDKATRREQMLELINRARASRDLPKLSLSPSLSKKAKRHSAEMAARGSIFHTEDLRAVLAPYDWSVGGENVGAGFSVEGLHDAFMDSPPHRENVLRASFRRVGIGFVRADGALWVTVIFYG